MQLELHLKPGASTRIFNAIVAILQVTPATQPASCTLPIASHCIPRLQLLQFLTLSVAGARYLARSGPWFEPGPALEPSQGCGRSRRAASVQPSSSTGTRCLWYNYQIWKLFHSLCMMIVCFAVPIICPTSIMHACIMSNHVPPHVTHECCVGGILGFAPARAFTRRANQQLGLKDRLKE